VIARLYSPDLLNAQQELIEAAPHPELREAAREKLRRWKITDEQVAAIERSGVASPLVDVVADVSGIVTARRVEEGDYVAPGTVLFELADLDAVWVLFDAHEADLPYLRVGDPVEYTLHALPGKRFEGRIAVVEPTLDEATRTAKVRVEISNAHGTMKPGMYARATARATLEGGERRVVVPRAAVLWTGHRSLVYVRHGDAFVFSPREVELGASLGDAYVILDGLAEGEEIVTSGLFAVDASAQLEGKRSMMNGEEPCEESGGVEATLPVQGLCGMCRKRIEATVGALPGVHDASWDATTCLLSLRHDPKQTPLSAIAAALAAVGHDAGDARAPDAVYNALPLCCKYRD
jgi:Cu(I)/Ag(I) efflux system membrane fusion protein